MNTTYPPLVHALLTLGEVRPDEEPRDYSALGIGPEHVPHLVRMATDQELRWADSESLEVWAPVHAWRALGEIGAVEAAGPLLSLLDDDASDDWSLDEVPELFGKMGPAVLPMLVEALGDRARDTGVRIGAARGIREVAQRHSGARDECVELLIRALDGAAGDDPEVNAFVIANLVKLRAAEAAPAIERAFAANAVDEFVRGDWTDVQVDLGLLPEEARPPRPDLLSPEAIEAAVARMSRANERWGGVPAPRLPLAVERGSRHRTRARGRDEAKAKRKAEKKARKANRRRR